MSETYGYVGDSLVDLLEVDITDGLQGKTVEKAVISCGGVIKVIEEPVFPLTISFTEEETNKMGCCNTANMAVWILGEGKRTCEGGIIIQLKGKVVPDV